MRIAYINEHNGKHRIDSLDRGLLALGHKFVNVEEAQIVWVEHLDKTAEEMSKRKLNVPLVLRLSAMELYKCPIKNIKWSNVSALVVHGKHLKDYFIETFGCLDKHNIYVVPLCIDTDKFGLKDSEQNKKVAIVSEVHWRKGAQIIPQVIENAPEGFHFYHIGQIINRDPLNFIKWRLSQRGLLGFYHFEGVSDNVSRWLEDKTYFLHCSGTEGMPRAVGEAMSKGLKPIIFNYRGAEKQWTDTFTWDYFDELDNMYGECEPEVYRKFILDNYSIPIVAKKVEDLCKSLVEKK